MKKLFVFIAALTFVFTVYAQKPEEIKVSALPKNVTAWIIQNFKKATMDKAVKVTDNKNLLGYCVVVATDGRKMIFVFDKNGKYLNKIKKMAEVQNILKPAQPATQPARK